VEEFFVKNIKGLILLNKGIRKIYLGFKILLFNRKIRKENKVYDDDEEIDPLEDLPLPEPDVPELIGWYYYELGNSQGRIRPPKSDFITMYKPPLLKLPFNKRAVKETKIKLKFTYKELQYEMASLPFFAELRLKKKQKADKIKKEKLDKFEKVYKEPFIRNDKIQWENRAFDKGSGIDLYIDALRFLPDNVTTTKIVIRIVDSYLNDLIFPQAGLPELGSDMLNPEYNWRQELRSPSYDPTSMLYITYLTVDARGTEKQPKILGYSFLPLFINKYKEAQPTNRSEMAFSVLNTGYYQIPIYCQQYKEEKPFFAKF
jgi:hypothetical protein